MFVRTASRRDLDAVRELLVETWHDTYDGIYGRERVSEITDEWHSIPALEARLDMPQSEFLVADDGKTIGGMAFARAVEGGRTVMLHQLYVRPGMQGRGIGRMLLDEVAECFHEAQALRVEVEEANKRAVAFYLSHGFAKVGATKDCGAEGSGIPAAIYERPIAAGDGTLSQICLDLPVSEMPPVLAAIRAKELRKGHVARCDGQDVRQ